MKIVAGGVVWNPSYGIAIVSQNHDSWSLPKGHVENGETLLECAAREVEEETGIPRESLVIHGQIAEFERERIRRHIDDPGELRRITLFLMTTTHETLSPKDPINPEARWLSPKEAVLLLTHPIDKAELGRIIESPLFQEVTKRI